ncbi:hypothetical protein K1719_027581 [Acacia pycnantha]|nr:hypothetical protein K1719_027581 [Acacia pycnantha]
MKAALGQIINLEAIYSAFMFVKEPKLALTHVTVLDLRFIDWKFGPDVAIFSNSAGLHEYDPDGSKARTLEEEIGIRVIRHSVKKPAGSADEIERHFGCESSKLIMVGDRPFTDIVFGNRNGFLTILTKPFSLDTEPFVVQQCSPPMLYLFSGNINPLSWCNENMILVAQKRFSSFFFFMTGLLGNEDGKAGDDGKVRKLEASFLNHWRRRGLEPPSHKLLFHPQLFVKEPLHPPHA